MKKNNTAEKTVLDAERIAKALKEGTEKKLRAIMNETISNMLMEEDDEKEDNSYEEEDVEPVETPVDDENTDKIEAGAEEGSEEEPTEEPEQSDDDEWSDMEQYKVGDNDYDFTGVDGDELLKVYNKLGDDDQIFVKKEDDGTYSVKDDETGAEFVIELNPEKLGDEAESDFSENEPEEGDSVSDFGDDDVEIDFEGEEDGDEPETDDEIEIELGDDDDELNEEDLGYTDNYQKDVFDKKFNMKEPADSKTTNDWDNGAPKGAEKPWAGKGDMQPFEKKVNECGIGQEPVETPEADANLEEAGYELRKSSTTTSKTETGNHEDYMSKPTTRNVSKNGVPVRGTASNLQESIRKIVSAAKEIQAENKQYKGFIDRIKKSLYEAAILNVNDGKLISLLVNETLTKEEKKNLVERFGAVKTISEGKQLYNTIKSELNEKRVSAPIVEKQFVAEAKNLNETTIYQNVNDPSIDLMNRMDNLFKKQK